MAATTLWTQYQVDGDIDARDQLLMQHLRLVHHVARQVIRSSRIDAEFDDLVSAGTIGLMNAVDNFDPGRGLAFSTFAAPRIRGAILDDLRRRDHVPRSIRRKQRELNRAKEALMAKLCCDCIPDKRTWYVPASVRGSVTVWEVRTRTCRPSLRSRRLAVTAVCKTMAVHFCRRFTKARRSVPPKRRSRKHVCRMSVTSGTIATLRESNLI